MKVSCSFMFCGCQIPNNSKIKKKKKKNTLDKEMAHTKIRFCKVIIIITLSVVVKRMTDESQLSLLPINICSLLLFLSSH